MLCIHSPLVGYLLGMTLELTDPPSATYIEPPGKDCRWKDYGCPVTTVVDQATHDYFCDFLCDGDADRCWSQLRNYEKTHEICADGYWNVLAIAARTFTMIPTASPTCGIWPPSKKAPFIFDSAAPWTTTPPTAADLYKHAMSEIPVSSPQHANSVKVLGQILHPSHRPSEVEYMVSLTPPYILSTYPFRLPHWLSSQWTDAEGAVLMDATPKFSCLDIHCDRGLSTVSVALDKMVNLWLIWPPTEHNKTIFYAAREECTRTGTRIVDRIGTQLTDGAIFIADRTHALYLPSGYLSLIYTLEGGITTGMSFSGREDLPSFVECVQRELKEGTDVEDLKSTIRYLLSTMERSLMERDTAVVYSTACLWMRVMQSMKDAAARGLDWMGMRRGIHQLLIRCRAGNSLMVDKCPCGMLLNSPFFVHFVRHRL